MFGGLYFSNKTITQIIYLKLFKSDIKNLKKLREIFAPVELQKHGFFSEQPWIFMVNSAGIFQTSVSKQVAFFVILTVSVHSVSFGSPHL